MFDFMGTPVPVKASQVFPSHFQYIASVTFSGCRRLLPSHIGHGAWPVSHIWPFLFPTNFSGSESVPMGTDEPVESQLSVGEFFVMGRSLDSRQLSNLRIIFTNLQLNFLSTDAGRF